MCRECRDDLEHCHGTVIHHALSGDVEASGLSGDVQLKSVNGDMTAPMPGMLTASALPPEILEATHWAAILPALRS